MVKIIQVFKNLNKKNESFSGMNNFHDPKETDEKVDKKKSNLQKINWSKNRLKILRGMNKNRNRIKGSYSEK